MAIGNLIGQPLDANQKYNWVLVIELVLSGVLYVQDQQSADMH